MTKTSLFLTFFLINSLIVFSQSKYYIDENRKTYDDKTYQELKNNYSENVKNQYGEGFVVKENLIEKISNQDSIVYSYSWVAMPLELYNMQIEVEKNLNQRIIISSLTFLNNGDNQKFDDSKPTFINFWFTNCPPCIEEIPALNELKELYKDKVNFVAITFDKKEKVEKFLPKFPFHFVHIVDANQFIDDLKINAYPTSFILNKNQELKLIEGSLPVKSADEYTYQIVMGKLREKINELL